MVASRMRTCTQLQPLTSSLALVLTHSPCNAARTPAWHPKLTLPHANAMTKREKKIMCMWLRKCLNTRTRMYLQNKRLWCETSVWITFSWTLTLKVIVPSSAASATSLTRCLCPVLLPATVHPPRPALEIALSAFKQTQTHTHTQRHSDTQIVSRCLIAET